MIQPKPSIPKLLAIVDARRAGIPESRTCVAQGCDNQRNPGRCHYCAKCHPGHQGREEPSPER